MTVIATGILSLPLDHLKTLIANTDAFQSWTGTADATAAAARVHLVSLPESGLVRPFALIGFGDKWKYENRGGLFDTEGELFALFEADVSPGNQASEADAVIEFANAVGNVLSDMFALSGTDDYLYLSRAEYAKQPERKNEIDAEMAEDYYSVELSFYWGGI